MKWTIGRVQDLESGKVKELKASEAEEIQEKFLINGWWLLTGKGKMLEDGEANLPIAVQAPPEDDENAVALNYYPDIVAAAGYGGINEYEFRKQTMKFDRRFLEQFLNIRRFDCLDIITVFGNSMEPFISNGETVIVERIDDARNGETVIANINGDIYIKRIKKDPLNRWVKFLSDNNEYDEIELKGKDLEHVTIIGIVRAKIRPF
ncbi:LexA family transcriptional regulator [Sulfuricurvum sp.]|uniref:S24 family peptidase n=1 Tax=Sulfuricurvum sp. TaxID=2025608 RepID=UPI002604A0F0|nr:LexA family transcriptional regulator [Sulfuricurvum sp.]